MTNEDVIEGNKLIAKFLKLKYYPETANHGIADNTYEYGFELFSPERLRFHSSWDWLMPVVEKIESLGFTVDIAHKSCLISGTNKNNFYSNPISSNISKIEAVYIAIIQFIKWYNENKQE